MADHAYTRMDTERVKKIAQKLRKIAGVLGTLIKGLTLAINALKAASFFSLGASLATAAFLSVVKKQMQKEKEKLEELARDVDKAVAAYLDYDKEGKTRFYWGV